MAKKETVVMLVAKFVTSVSRSAPKMPDNFITLLQNLSFREISVPLTTENHKNPFKGSQVVPYESTNGQRTHILKLIFVFHNYFANVPPPATPTPQKRLKMWLIFSQ